MWRTTPSSTPVKRRTGWGYAVFGRVTRGMDVVDKIAQAKTGRKAGMSDVPVKTVTIRSVKIVK